MECEVKNFSDAINLQMAVEKRSKSVTLLEVTSRNGVTKPLEVGAQKGMIDSPTKKKRKKTVSVSSSSKTIKDTRAVWIEKKHGKVLNTSLTLKNIGLSEKQLMSMKTKIGTLEHSLKCTIRTKNYWAKAGRK
jgi:hypothetical protein